MRYPKLGVTPHPRPEGGWFQNFWGYHWVRAYPEEDGGWVVLSPTGEFVCYAKTWWQAADIALPLRPAGYE